MIRVVPVKLSGLDWKTIFTDCFEDKALIKVNLLEMLFIKIELHKRVLKTN